MEAAWGPELSCLVALTLLLHTGSQGRVREAGCRLGLDVPEFLWLSFLLTLRKTTDLSLASVYLS